MNSDVFYMTSIAVSITGLFGLWHVGIKPLLLDNFRDALFTQRDRLYALGNSGKLSYNSDAYRAVEVFLNSLIRYAYRFSFLSLLISLFTFDVKSAHIEGHRPSTVLSRKVREVGDVSVRAELDSIVKTVSMELLPRYIAKSSVVFLIGAGIYLVLSTFSPLAASLRKTVVATFEAEAYRDSNTSVPAAA